MLVLLEMTIIAQTTFQKTYGSFMPDAGYSVVQTEDSCFVFTGNWCYGGGWCTNHLFVIKTDVSGNTLWSKFYYNNIGYEGDAGGNSIIETIEHDFVIAGYTTIYNPSMNIQFYLVKTDSNGDSLWTKYYGEDYYEHAYSVKQTLDGGFILSGYTDTIPGLLGTLLLIKTNASGDSLWGKTYGFGYTRPGVAHSILEINNGYIILGYTSEANYSGNNDVYLIRTDIVGDTLWTKTYGGTNDDIGYSIQKTPDNGFIFTGATFSFGAGGYDVYLIKTDSNGTLLWSKTYGGLDNEYGNFVSNTSDGGYIITGSTESFSTGGGYDVYLIKIDTYGNQQWYKTFGSINNDYGYSVQQTFDGGYIICGIRNENIYLIKTDINGNTTNINEIDISKLISKVDIYPNPTTGLVSIKAERIKSIEVINLQGKQIYTGKENQIDLSTQPKGIYIIKVITDKQTITQKLIKQ